MADQTLDPNDPAAQAFIAGQSMAPVQTDPTANMTPATPGLPPPQAGPMSPATLPLVESAAGTEAPMLAPEQGTQDTGVAAQPNPLPADAPAPPKHPRLRPATTTNSRPSRTSRWMT